jgi:hypothetical protein
MCRLYNFARILLILCGGFSVSATAEVTPAAQFATSLPVIVPDFHHIEPQLAFTYSSTTANEWLGAGWSLNGPSYIAQMSKDKLSVTNHEVRRYTDVSFRSM